MKLQTNLHGVHTSDAAFVQSESQPIRAAEAKSDVADDEGGQETFADDEVSIANTSLLDRPPKAPARRLQDTSIAEDEPSQVWTCIKLLGYSKTI